MKCWTDLKEKRFGITNRQKIANMECTIASPKRIKTKNITKDKNINIAVIQHDQICLWIP